MKKERWVLGVLAMFAANLAMGQTPMSPPQEYGKYVDHAGSIEGFADFGDQVNLRDGSLQVRYTDIELAGTGPTIRITRTFQPGKMGQDFYETSGNGFGLWELEVPRIKTNTTAPTLVGVMPYSPVGWQVIGQTTAAKNARCTGFQAPGPVGFINDSARGWDASEWWAGYHLVDDGGNEQALMSRNDKTVRSDVPLMTTGNWLVGCLATTSNGAPGEAFYALASDGTKYWFDRLVYASADLLQKPLWTPPMLRAAEADAADGESGDGATGQSAGKAGGPVLRTIAEFDQLERSYASMLVTRVEDRFGNWVTYDYTNGYLTSIDASDGRHVGLSRNGTTTTITVGTGVTAQTWTYQSGSLAAGTFGDLTVTRPDGSQWQYSLPILPASALLLSTEASDPTASCTIDPDDFDSFHEGTIVSPSGATLTLTVNRKRFARSYVPRECWGGDPTVPLNMHGYAVYPREWYAFALVSRKITGPGLADATWTYHYAPPVSSWQQDCPGPTSCVSTVWTDVTAPDGTRRRMIYSNKFDETENKLLREEDYSASSQLLRAVDHQYATATFQSNPYPWPVEVGHDWRQRVNTQTSGQWAPERYKRVDQQGVEFTWQVPTNCGGGMAPCFDAFARPTKVARSSDSPLSYARTETTAYHDNTSKWVLGQVASVTCSASVPTSAACDGDVVSAATYDATYALPLTFSAFGKLQQTLGWDTTSSIAGGQRGTLATITDGNTRTTTYGSWKRGIPQAVTFADSTLRSAVVDDLGRITAATDENGYTTNYTYDAMGRLAGIAWPTGDSTAWNATTQTFEQVAGTEAGIGAGHWRQTVATGNARRITWYDGLWRPLVTREYDTADETASTRYQRLAYDHDGRTTFASYPGTSDSLTTGTRTAYDALGRPTSVSQDSELGTLATTTQYLTGFQRRITDARGQATTAQFMAWDTPGFDLPVLVSHPAGAYTHIARDAFGKPTLIRRSNNSSPTGGTTYIDRSYTYNANQELCRAVEPETGATLYGYDPAGNLKWSAAGLATEPTLPGCEPNGTSSPVAARRVDRSYDARNRISTLTFPDGNGNQTWTYAPDGLPLSVTTANDAGASSVINSYTWNKRRLRVGEALVQSGNATVWAMGYGFDANAHPASLVYPSELTLTITANALGQPTQIASATQTYASAIAYWPNGALKQFTYGNGIVHSLTQNARQLPLRSQDLDGSAPVHDDSYTYDANGNVAAIADSVPGNRGNRAMTYDALDRLTDVSSPMYGATGAHYSYDVLDNITGVTAPSTGGSLKAYCYDEGASWQLTNVKAGSCGGVSEIGLGYDVQGNLANKNGILYGFDYGNRLRGTSTERYRYDAWGRRVRTDSVLGTGLIYSLYGQDGTLYWTRDERTGRRMQYVYLGGSLIAQRMRPIGVTAETVTWQHTDALGSPVAVTSASLTVIQTSEYEPYGYLLNRPLEDGPGFTGHVMDAATGLIYMQQRYMGFSLPRFLSADPVTAYQQPFSNFNPYVYANNNPYRFTDPDGRQSRDFEAISKQAGTYLQTPPPSDKDWLGPAIGVALTGMLAAPVAAEAGMYMLANPGTFATATNIAAEATGVTGTAAGAGLLAREAAGVLKPAGKLIGQAGSSSQVRLLQGGPAEAGQLFQQLSKGGEAVKGTKYPGALMRIGEEATVGLRPTSKSGPPTIDVNIPGLNIREIKFIDNAQ